MRWFESRFLHNFMRFTYTDTSCGRSMYVLYLYTVSIFISVLFSLIGCPKYHMCAFLFIGCPSIIFVRFYLLGVQILNLTMWRVDMAGLGQRVLRTCAGSGQSSALAGLIMAVVPAIFQWYRTSTFRGGWRRVSVRNQIERNCHSPSTAAVMFPYTLV